MIWFGEIVECLDVVFLHLAQRPLDHAKDARASVMQCARVFVLVYGIIVLDRRLEVSNGGERLLFGLVLIGHLGLGDVEQKGGGTLVRFCGANVVFELCTLDRQLLVQVDGLLLVGYLLLLHSEVVT